MMVVFVRVMFYDRIENADQLRAATNLPVFGEIIASEKAEENYVVVDTDPKSAITESFRTVRTNLEYLPSTDKGKVVMVTSYRPNEGKTFCSVNLSAILAKAGKKVLLLGTGPAQAQGGGQHGDDSHPRPQQHPGGQGGCPSVCCPRRSRTSV
jgi:tyrosine-protein kinase Etk/Wzc